MEFRLTYRGPLGSTQKEPQGGQKDSGADHRHDIRRVFHRQLQRLWEITPFLKTGRASGGPPVFADHRDPAPKPYHKDSLAARHSMYGFNFVPLVNHDFDLRCGLEILLLRPDRPGGIVWAGALDDRLKTLFNALTIPAPNEGYDQQTPAADEIPLFCLLQDDKLITGISVETDQLLDWDGRDLDETAIVITVRLRPHDTTLHNLKFG